MRRAALFSVLAALLLGGCTVPFTEFDLAETVHNTVDFISSDNRVIITTGLSEDELFRIEDRVCTAPEYLVYLINMQKIYENGFSDSLWRGSQGELLCEDLKSAALARISHIKAMTLLAEQHGITLEEEEKEKIAEAAAGYDASLSDADRHAMGDVTPETLTMMMEEYCLAEKVYLYLLRDIDPEISDDEARRVHVRQIVLTTYRMEADGTRTPYSLDEKEAVLRRARQIYNDCAAGTSFDELSAAYNESEETEYTFGRGERDPLVESIAFSLNAGQVSTPFETDEGIVLLYMISTNDPAETEDNKIRIMDERRHETFDSAFETFSAGLARTLDEEMYESIRLSEDPDVTTTDFFTSCEDIIDQ